MNAQAVAQRWANNLGAATDKIKAGVAAVTVAPTQAAAQAQSAYLAGVQNAVSSGRWAASLQAVSLSDWQNAMNTKGINRIAAGATGAVPKMQSFMTQFLPFLANGVAQLASTPRGGLEQNIARATQMMRYNAGFRYQK